MVIFYLVVPSFLTRRTDKQIRREKEEEEESKNLLDDFLRKQIGEREMCIKYCI